MKMKTYSQTQNRTKLETVGNNVYLGGRYHNKKIKYKAWILSSNNKLQNIKKV